MIAKFVLGDKILPKIMEHIAKVYKLDRIVKYMELPNEADIASDKALKKCEDIEYELGAIKEFLKDLDNKVND